MLRFAVLFAVFLAAAAAPGSNYRGYEDELQLEDAEVDVDVLDARREERQFGYGRPLQKFGGYGRSQKSIGYRVDSNRQQYENDRALEELRRELEDEVERRTLEDQLDRRASEDQEDRRTLEDQLDRKTLEEQIYDCKNHFDECSSFPPCCGSLQCYWASGFSLITKGVCVPCIDRTQTCQRDKQCCSPLVCHKASRFNVDGVCDVKRVNGAECHDSDQCESNYCSIAWFDDLKGKGGKCAAHTTRSIDLE